MPGFSHELLVDLFRQAPGLARTLLRGVGIELPDGVDEVGSIDLSQVTSPSYASDMVLRVRVGDERYAACVVVEVQLDKDDEKRLTWPVYVTAARRSLACPAVLLVVTPDDGVARWARHPIEIGHPGFTLAPVVIGRERVPEVTESEVARRLPELAVLSVLAHPANDVVARTAIAAVSELAEERVRLYLDVIWSVVTKAVRTALEQWMEKHEYQSDFARKYFAEGMAEGKAEGMAEGKAEGMAEGKAEGSLDATRSALLRVLERRGFTVSARVRQRIEAEGDLEQLLGWLDAAVTAASIAEVFADA